MAASNENKVYSIVDVEIIDPDLFKEYVAGHMQTLEPYGGRFLVTGRRLRGVGSQRLL